MENLLTLARKIARRKFLVITAWQTSSVFRLTINICPKARGWAGGGAGRAPEHRSPQERGVQRRPAPSFTLLSLLATSQCACDQQMPPGPCQASGDPQSLGTAEGIAKNTVSCPAREGTATRSRASRMSSRRRPGPGRQQGNRHPHPEEGCFYFQPPSSLLSPSNCPISASKQSIKISASFPNNGLS